MMLGDVLLVLTVGLLVGSAIGWLGGIRATHKRYEAAKTADRGKYEESIQACWRENDHRFNAERRAYQTIDLTPLHPTQIGKN